MKKPNFITLGLAVVLVSLSMTGLHYWQQRTYQAAVTRTWQSLVLCRERSTINGRVNLKTYYNELAAIDEAGLPYDFKAAFEKFIRAVNDAAIDHTDMADTFAAFFEHKEPPVSVRGKAVADAVQDLRQLSRKYGVIAPIR